MAENGSKANGAGRRTPDRGAPSDSRIRFDAVDLAILNQLQGDSKVTNAALAKRVGVSATAALERVRKLERAGVISGYAARVNPGAVGKGLTALVHVRLREHGERQVAEFKREIASMPEVQAAWHTTGDEDFVIKVLVSDMAAYEAFVVGRLAAAPHIGRVRTSFCLTTIKDGTAVPLDAVGG